MDTVRYHPRFARQLEDLATWAESSDQRMELFGEVLALLRALEDHGHEIEGHRPKDASHPIMSSRFQTFALRRTPPTLHTPDADEPPVLRIPYVWFDRAEGGEVAVVMLIGDKTALGNDWYPPVVAQIEGTMIDEWHELHPNHRAQVRRSRKTM